MTDREEPQAAVIYARVSTTKQADKGLSIPGQVERCKRKLEDEGYYVQRIFTEAESASESADHRGAFQEMVAHCRRGKAKALCVFDTSRFSRKREDAVVYKALLRRKGIRILYVSHDLGDGDDDRFVEGLFELLDERAARVQGKLAARGMADNARAGYFNGGVPPYGYRWTHIMVGVAKKLTLEKDPVTAPLIRRIFDMALGGRGCIDVARTLNREGITTRKGCRWTNTTVHGVLTNVRYIGNNVATLDGKRTVIEGTHTPIIDKETWERVQKTLHARSPRNSHGRINPRREVKFAGVLYCGICGSALVSTTGKSSTGKLYHYYECSNARKSGECEGQRYRALEYDELLMEVLMDHVFVEENIQRTADALLSFTVGQKEAAEKEKADIRHQLQQVKTKISRLYEILEDPESGFSPRDLSPRMAELQRSRDNLERQEVSVVIPDAPVLNDEMRKEAVELVRGTIEKATPVELVDFLRKFDLRIKVKPDSLSFEANPALFLSEALSTFATKNVWRARGDSNA